MDLRDFGSALARWWYISLATLLLATLGAVGLYRATGPTYEADSTVLLLPPEAVLVAAREDQRNYAPNNPLLYLSSLTDARDVLVRHLTSKDVLDELKDKAPGAKLTIAGDLTSGSPLILVKSEAATESAALAGTKAVNDLVPGTLKNLQDQMDIASLQRIDSLKITSDSKGTPNNKKQLTMAGVGFAGITVLGLVLIALLDQLRNRRKRRDGVNVARDDRRELAPAPRQTTARTSTAGTTSDDHGSGASPAPLAPARRSADAPEDPRA